MLPASFPASISPGRRPPRGAAARPGLRQECGPGFGPVQAQGLCSVPMKRHAPFRTGTILLGSLCLVSTALATTYVRVEKDGTKTYSDRPIPGGQPVELQSAQTYTAAPAPPTADPNSPAEQR